MMQGTAAVPYFSVFERLMEPLRPREVICELLAGGIPVSPTAHVSLKTVPDCKAFVRAAKKLVAHVRSKVPQFSHHVAVAADRGLLSNACMAYIKEARGAVHGTNIALAAGALKAVVRLLVSFARVCCGRTCMLYLLWTRKLYGALHMYNVHGPNVVQLCCNPRRHNVNTTKIQSGNNTETFKFVVITMACHIMSWHTSAITKFFDLNRRTIRLPPLSTHEARLHTVVAQLCRIMRVLSIYSPFRVVEAVCGS